MSTLTIHAKKINIINVKTTLKLLYTKEKHIKKNKHPQTLKKKVDEKHKEKIHLRMHNLSLIPS